MPRVFLNIAGIKPSTKVLKARKAPYAPKAGIMGIFEPLLTFLTSVPPSALSYAGSTSLGIIIANTNGATIAKKKYINNKIMMITKIYFYIFFSESTSRDQLILNLEARARAARKLGQRICVSVSFGLLGSRKHI